jgi:hypothetical protein
MVFARPDSQLARTQVLPIMQFNAYLMATKERNVERAPL